MTDTVRGSMKGKTLAQQIFAEKKKHQLNNGPCAAVMADCDCDQCLRLEARKEADKAQIVASGEREK